MPWECLRKPNRIQLLGHDRIDVMNSMASIFAPWLLWSWGRAETNSAVMHTKSPRGAKQKRQPFQTAMAQPSSEVSTHSSGISRAVQAQRYKTHNRITCVNWHETQVHGMQRTVVNFRFVGHIFLHPQWPASLSFDETSSNLMNIQAVSPPNFGFCCKYLPAGLLHIWTSIHIYPICCDCRASPESSVCLQRIFSHVFEDLPRRETHGFHRKVNYICGGEAFHPGGHFRTGWVAWVELVDNSSMM